MKQCITIKQWNQLEVEQKKEFVNKSWDFDYDNNHPYPEFITIGQMIEFLGDDLNIIENNNWWQVKINYRVESNIPTYDTANKKELCDALWEVVVYKLNK